MNIFENNIGFNALNLKYLGDGIASLKLSKINKLSLNLFKNSLGIFNIQNMEYLTKSIAKLKDSNIRVLTLNLFRSKLGANVEN